MKKSSLLNDSKQIIDSDFFNESPISAFIWRDKELLSLENVSENIFNLSSYNKEEFISGKIYYLNIIHPDDLQKVTNKIQENSLLKNKNFTHEPYRIKKANNEYIWVNDKTSIVYLEGEIAYIISYISECTYKIENTKELEFEVKEQALKLKTQYEELELEKTKLSAIIKTLPDLLWMKDEKGVYLTCNKRFEDFFGAKEKDIIGKTDYDFVNKELADFFRKNDKAAMNSDKALINYEELPFASDGHKEYVMTSKSKVLSPKGQIYGVLGIGRDFTKIKDYESKLIQQKQEFEQLFNNAQVGLMYISKDRVLVTANPYLADILAYDSPEEMIGISMHAIHLSEENFIEFGKQYFSNLVNGIQRDIEYQLRKKDGSALWVNISGKAVDDNIPADISKGVLWSIQDISKRKEIETKIIMEKNRSKHYLDIAGNMIIALNKEGIITLINHKACEILGEEEEDIIGKNWFDNYLVSDELEFVKDIFSQIINGKVDNVKYVENYIKTKTGKLYHIAWHNSIAYEDNQIIGLLSSGTDITEKEKLHKQILSQKEEFETIFKTIKDGIAVIDFETRFVNCNEAICNLLGYTKAELLSKKCSDLTVREDIEKNNEAIKEAIEKGYVENVEKRCINKDGKQLSINMSISLLPNKKNLLLSIRDITSFKLLEEKSKLVSMGEMIGNIAHQWRQPLSVISTSASGMQLQSELGLDIEKKDIIRFSEIIMKQAEYLSNTIENFRNFLKEDKQYSVVNVNEIMEYTFSLVKASLSNNYINLICDIDTTLHINGNKNELSEAFINIINNSKDAIKENVKDVNNRFIFVTVKENKENKVEILFKDSGGGIADNIINRVLEPYFTSKHQSVGTGLGLSMADKIIRERHKGLITVYNEEFEYNNKNYKGACFKIVFDVENLNPII